VAPPAARRGDGPPTAAQRATVAAAAGHQVPAAARATMATAGGGHGAPASRGTRAGGRRGRQGQSPPKPRPPRRPRRSPRRWRPRAPPARWEDACAGGRRAGAAAGGDTGSCTVPASGRPNINSLYGHSGSVADKITILPAPHHPPTPAWAGHFCQRCGMLVVSDQRPMRSRHVSERCATASSTRRLTEAPLRTRSRLAML